MKKIIAINGDFYCREITGVERLAVEVTRNLDALRAPGEMEIVVPANARNVPDFSSIKVVRLKKNLGSFTKWTQIDFQGYILSHKNRIALDYTNACPFFAPGIEFIHDIYCELYPRDFEKKDSLKRLYSALMYRAIARRAKEVVTVSEYTKKTIVETYRANPEKISVVYSGIDNFKNIKSDRAIFEKFPRLLDGEFYFTLGSLSVRKNLKWIAKHAEIYQNELFVISGKALLNVVPDELKILQKSPNVIMPGYLSDGEVKALMERCKAFVFPSYFEGFGLPPLEALSCGAKIVVSSAASLPEIYGRCAHYIDPNEPDVDLPKLLEEEVEPPEALLEKYTFENTARRLCAAIDRCAAR